MTKRIFIYCSTLVLSFCFASALSAQATWTVSTNAKSIAAGEPFNITYTLNGAKGTDFRGPTFKRFKRINGPNTQTSISIVNGRSSQSMAYVYTVIGGQTGTFRLPKATITVQGKAYQTTNDVRVEVVKAKAGAAGTQEKDPVLLIASLSDSVVTIGQPVEYELKLYTLRSEAEVREISSTNFDAFYREVNNDKMNRVYTEVFNGQTYSTKVLLNFTLYPLDQGLIELAPYELYVSMVAANQPRRRSFFDRRVYNKYQAASAPLRLAVNGLPSGAPAAFSGAVGVWDVSCRVDRSILTTDDVVRMEMKIFGKGDTKKIEAPKVNSTDSLEVYPPTLKEEREEKRSWGLEKVKIYEYAILPKFPGQYLINPGFVFYDTDSLAYVEQSCQPINLRVTQGSNKKRTIVKQPVIDDGLEELVEAEAFAGFPSPGLSAASLWSIFGGFTLSLLGMIGYRVYLDKQPEVDHVALREAAAQKVALAQLAEAQGHLKSGQVKPFYESLSAALYGYLVDKLKLPPADLNLSNIKSELSNRQVPQEHIDNFSTMIQSAQMALYAGSQAKENMPQNFEAGKEWIISMEEWLGR